MRAAPAVSVRCSGGVSWRLFQALVPALAAAALAAWVLSLGQLPAEPALWVAPAVAAIAWRCARPAQRVLSWDGQCWRLDGREGGLEPMIDVGGWMLLRFGATGPRRGRTWVAVCRADAGPALHGLRAAVYCRPPEPTPGTRTAPDGPTAARPD